MNKFEKVVLITGCAGFIGAALSKRFLAANFKVIGIDNLNNYYDRQLKYDRLEDIENSLNNRKYLWDFFKISVENILEINDIFSKNKPKIVINLAAQAGVRFSIKNPATYVK